MNTADISPANRNIAASRAGARPVARLLVRVGACVRDACARVVRANAHVGILTAALAVPGVSLGLAPAAALAETPATAAVLEAAAASAIETIRALPQAAGARLEVEALPFDPRVGVAPCSTPVSAELIGKRLAGPRASVRVRCTDAQNPWSLAVALRVALFQPVLVARRALVRGDTVDAGTTELAERDVLQLGYGHLDDPARLAGARVLRPIAAGAALAPTAIAPPLLVERDSTVTLVARGPAIDVRAVGTALDDGSAGARVRVRNASSGRTVDGIVDGPGTVVIGR